MVPDWLCKTGLIWGLGLGPMATAQDPRYRKRPPLRMASVDQGHAIRVGFPSSLSLEPNGHISASCHCHPLSIRSGLAPSSQLLRPKPQRFGCASALLRRHWTICLTPGQWCAECPGVGMLGRSVGKAGRQEKQAGEVSSSVWTGCLSLSLKKTTSILLPQNASVLSTCCRMLSGTRQGTITPSFHLRPAQDSRPSRLQPRTKSQRSRDPNGHCSDCIRGCIGYGCVGNGPATWQRSW